MAEDIFSAWNPLKYDKQESPFLKRVPIGVPLSTKQEKALKELTHQTRVADLEYLNRHPEVRGIIREFLHQFALENPFDVRKFGQKLFSQPKEALCTKVAKHVADLKEIQRSILVGSSSATSTLSSSTSCKIPSSSSLQVGKCLSVDMPEILGLPKGKIEKSPTIPLTQSSSTETSESFEVEFEGMAEDNDIQDSCRSCRDCECLIPLP